MALYLLRADTSRTSAFISFRNAALSILQPKRHIPSSHSHVIQVRWKKSGLVTNIPTLRARKAEEKDVPGRNEGIQHPIVQLIDPQTGKLSEPQPLRNILLFINRNEEYVQLVTDKPGPIVKIFKYPSRSDEIFARREAERKKREEARKNIQKEVQLTWTAAPEDVAHKISQIRALLERGARVDVIISRKSGQAKLRFGEMETRMEEIVHGVADVGKEWKAREVRSNLTAIFLQATSTPESKKLKRLQIHKKKIKIKKGEVPDMYQGD